MEITEVRVKLMEKSDDRLQAFCSITLDHCFVIRDLKIIEGTNGPFVAMPSRKLTSHCQHCGTKNHLRSAYCNQCGQRLKEERSVRDADGRTKLYADIAHPINSACRELIQGHVIQEYDAELQRSAEPGYISRYDDAYDDGPDVEAPGAEQVTANEGGPADSPATDFGTTPSNETARPTTQRSEIQPAEVEPRPPHRHPARTTAKPLPKRDEGKFGAGIFD